MTTGTNIDEKTDNTTAIDTDSMKSAFAQRKAATIAKSIQQVEAREKRKVGCPPLDVFPPAIHKLVYQLEHEYKFPPDFSLTAILYCVSVAIGNNYKVRVKNKWLEIAALYICIIAPPGTMKTPVLSYFLEVFRKIDSERYREYLNDLKVYQANVKAATKEKPFEGDEPIWKQLLLSDFTNEALIKALYNNHHGLGIAVDELAGFFAQLNRYSKGGDVQFFLSLFNGQNIVVNRKSAGSFPINNPFASIIGGIQPGVMKTVFTPDMWSNGMGDRFLYCYPAGLKKEIAGDGEPEAGLYDTYTNAIRFLLDIDNGPDPVCIDFEPDARKELNRYRQQQADAVNNANEAGNEQMAGIINKADYHVIRLSFILQVLHDAIGGNQPTTIKLTSVQAAADLTDYFIYQASRVIGLVAVDTKPIEKDEHRQFYESLPDAEFKLSDAIKIALELRPAPPGREADNHLNTIKMWVKRFLAIPEKFSNPSHGRYSKKPITS